ncbi:cell envelope integrity protein CreD [Sphingomicrobium marinum]|uniref:cell envelope integrity protein CreD n=1 Tax=Sphingomicrobium marinum TaxID=1227950 RepID=UPI002240D0D8|nr:cell envelope integrity protein CreD [Sphingomicrobium marinum]
MAWRGGTRGRTPGGQLAITILIGLLLAVPLFTVWALVYDRQSQSETAQASITDGWGDEQVLSGPLLIVPYTDVVEEQIQENGVTRTVRRSVRGHLTLSPELAEVETTLDPSRRGRSIYEAIVYEAAIEGQSRFVLTDDFERYDITADQVEWDEAQLQFGVRDPRGLTGNPVVTIGGETASLKPGRGSEGGQGFFAYVDASEILEGPMVASYSYTLRGAQRMAMLADAGSTRWSVRSNWPHPSFTGAFLPDDPEVSDRGFAATYEIGNLALGRTLLTDGEKKPNLDAAVAVSGYAMERGDAVSHGQAAVVSLIDPVDLYSRVDRAAKYGFLHIGFTFLALLMFDVVGGKRVSAVAYLLVGAALVLFFVLLLAFAEVIGFGPAYLVASAAIAGLVTLYTKAVLNGWKPALIVGGLLAALYAALYVLLGLESLSLLIGSLMLFAALAAVMYATRNLDWGHAEQVPE